MEQDSLLYPALQVNPALVRGGGVEAPRNGEEFLANVIVERLSCRDVMSVRAPSLADRQNVFFDLSLNTETPPQALLPTDEWQKYQVTEFHKIRYRLSTMDRGAKNRKNNPVRFPPIDTQDSATQWKKFVDSNEPLLSSMMKLKLSQIEFLLDVLTGCAEQVPHGEGLQPSHGKWLFATLGLLQCPLRSNAHSRLRDLARACHRIRSRLPFDGENVPKEAVPLNLFICLIATIFGQWDLSDLREN